MAGCFGNHPFDRQMENELMRHLEEEDTFICENCGHECHIDNCEYDENAEAEQCPICKRWQEI